MSGNHLPADDEIEIWREDHRNARRDRKRVTKMVVDGAGIKRMRTHVVGKLIVSRKKPAKR